MLRLVPLALAACLIAGAAAASSIINYVKIDTAYSPTDIAYAGGPGELWTEVSGNPFDTPKAEFDQAVTGAMYGAHFGPPTKFTTTPGANARRMFHVRLWFNGTAFTNSSQICAGQPTIAPAPDGGKIALYAAFCQDDEALTFLQAQGDGFSGPTDPQFREFMRDVTMQLFPPQNRELQRNRSDRCAFASC